MKDTKPYMSASLAGVLLGGVLLFSFVIAHRGIGASGAFADVAGTVLSGVGAVPQDTRLADRIPLGITLWKEWIVIELLAVMTGAFVSAWYAGRLRREDRAAEGNGVLRSLLGGVCMGVGARLAYGCTSGLALSGGALLTTGAWIFIPIAFAAAVVTARLLPSAASPLGR